MSQLTALIAEARAGLSIQQSIPQTKWEAIAARCQSEEIADIKRRIESLKLDLESVEEWDGDTQDEINAAIFKFSRLLSLALANT